MPSAYAVPIRVFLTQLECGNGTMCTKCVKVITEAFSSNKLAIRENFFLLAAEVVHPLPFPERSKTHSVLPYEKVNFHGVIRVRCIKERA